RILSSESGVSNHLIRAGMLSERNWRDLAEASARLAKARIFVDDTPGIDIMEMRAKARRLKMEVGLDLVMVDYLQLMSVKGRVESRHHEILQLRTAAGLHAVSDLALRIIVERPPAGVVFRVQRSKSELLAPSKISASSQSFDFTVRVVLTRGEPPNFLGEFAQGPKG